MIGGAPIAVAGALVEPPVFASSHGVLDLLMIARPKPVSTLAVASPDGAVLHPTGWVYEICPRPAVTDAAYEGMSSDQTVFISRS